MPRDNRKSFVWEFFEKSGDKTVKCKICSSIYQFHRTTTNMLKHLKRKHPVNFLESSGKQLSSTVRPFDNIEDEVLIETRPCTSQALSSTLPLDNERATLKRPSEENLVLNPIKRQRQLRLTAPSKINQKVIDEALVDMIVCDFQPLQIVENRGFARYTRKLNPDYSLPTRKNLEKMLKERYTVCSAVLKQKLTDVDYISITTDMWTSDSNQSFISATAHFIQQGEVNSFVLSTYELSGEHTSLIIANTVKTILNQWEVFDKIVSVVTDNASVMKKAVSDHLMKRNHYCVAHLLNLVVKDCLTPSKNITGKEQTGKEQTVKEQTENNLKKTLIELLAKCRSIVSHFKHSAKSTNKLREMQKQMGLEELKLKQDVSTRWNSTLLMVERLIRIKLPLSATLPLVESSTSNLNLSEWEVLDDCVILLKPIEKMTEILSGESYPTMSYVIPLANGLKNSIKIKEIKTDVGKYLQKSLLEVIDKRLIIYESNRTVAKATFLDPRFKKKAFYLESNSQNAEKWVIEELIQIQQTVEKNNIQSSCNTLVSTTQENEDDLWAQFDQKNSRNFYKADTFLIRHNCR